MKIRELCEATNTNSKKYPTLIIHNRDREFLTAKYVTEPTEAYNFIDVADTTVKVESRKSSTLFRLFG